MLPLLACVAEDSGKTVIAPDPDPGSQPTACAAVPAPAPPVFPEEIGTLTVNIRTGEDSTDGTDDAELELCLGEWACFPLDPGDGEPLDAGQLASWSFEGVGLARSSVDSLRLQTGDGSNQWEPVCLDLLFDGEPVHCTEMEVEIGDEEDESLSWSSELRRDCARCGTGPLSLGPMQGAVSADAASVWLRTDATRTVELRVEGRAAAWAQPTAEDDFTAVLRADCLEPGVAAAAELLVDDTPVWSGELHPEPEGPGAWRLAFGSCSKDLDQPIFSTIAEAEPDLFLFVGDNHYGNTDALDLHRHYYRLMQGVAERSAFLATTPTLATWDDHDFVGDNSDGSEDSTHARRAFTEYWANPDFGEEGEGVYFKAGHGDVDLFVLDDRSWRGVDGTLLGAKQRAWLEAELAASTATFKLVADGSVWNEDGGADSWDDFLDERAELFELFRAAGGVVLLSGDVHRSELREVESFPELVSSPLANLNSSCGSGEELLACYDDGNSFILVEIDSTLADPTLTASIIDEDGDVEASASWARSAL